MKGWKLLHAHVIWFWLEMGFDQALKCLTYRCLQWESNNNNVLSSYNYMHHILSMLTTPMCTHVQGYAACWTPSTLWNVASLVSELFNFCCYSPYFLHALCWLWWSLRGIQLNFTTWSLRLCWYSCLPWGLITAHEDRGPEKRLSPRHWPPPLPRLKSLQPSQLSYESSPGSAGHSWPVVFKWSLVVSSIVAGEAVANMWPKQRRGQDVTWEVQNILFSSRWEDFWWNVWVAGWIHLGGCHGTFSPIS